MKKVMRAGIAYIAGRLVTGKSCNAIFDCGANRAATIAGTVRVGMVNVMDKESKGVISGSGSGGRYSLKHEGIKNYIDLNIVGTTFTGFDHASGKMFNGRVSGNTVALFDCEDGSSSNYVL